MRLPKALPPLGAMIEVPGAALAADSLAAEADFFAIGTNDLIQYTLAIDRSDKQVAHLYNPLHPAVLRLIQFAIEAALRRGMPISVCGEMAGEPRFCALLLGLGLRNLSMAPRNIPRVKQRIRSLDMVAATRRARAIMDQSDSRAAPCGHALPCRQVFSPPLADNPVANGFRDRVTSAQHGGFGVSMQKSVGARSSAREGNHACTSYFREPSDRPTALRGRR